MIVDISDIPENKKINDYPDDTIFVMKDTEPRYLLNPFEIIWSNDLRYKDALTREDIRAMYKDRTGN